MGAAAGAHPREHLGPRAVVAGACIAGGCAEEVRYGVHHDQPDGRQPVLRTLPQKLLLRLQARARGSLSINAACTSFREQNPIQSLSLHMP